MDLLSVASAAVVALSLHLEIVHSGGFLAPSVLPPSRRRRGHVRKGGREGGGNGKAPRAALTACNCEWATL